MATPIFIDFPLNKPSSYWGYPSIYGNARPRICQTGGSGFGPTLGHQPGWEHRQKRAQRKGDWWSDSAWHRRVWDLVMMFVYTVYHMSIYVYVNVYVYVCVYIYTYAIIIMMPSQDGWTLFFLPHIDGSQNSHGWPDNPTLESWKRPRLRGGIIEGQVDSVPSIVFLDAGRSWPWLSHWSVEWV